MDKVVVVGSGVSGLHFTCSLLKKGYEVTMLDVGSPRSEPVNPDDGFQELKTNLPDPVRYFLGPKYEAVVYPDASSEYYGFPPSKDYVFTRPAQFSYRSKKMRPQFSFAQGGLGEAWTGGAYPFNERDFADFPFSYKDIEPHYGEAADRIGVTGWEDDLSQFFPVHENLGHPVDLDEHSRLLLAAYQAKRGRINREFKCYLGRARNAVLSADRGGRKACSYRGRCLWGCPSDSFYTPSITLRECLKFPNFKYLPGHYVSHFVFDGRRRITHAVADSLEGGGSRRFPVDRLVLAAGTLATARIFMESIRRDSGETIKLTGLMDNRQVLIPFLTLRMFGRNYEPQNYQYHQLAFGFPGRTHRDYLHAQITTLKTALLHPFIQTLPFDLKTSLTVFRNMHAALGMVNANLHDSRREQSYLTLEADSSLSIHYAPALDEDRTIREAVRKIRKVLSGLGCFAPPWMVHARPYGAAVHYSGTLPMTKDGGDFTVSKDCRSRDFENLFVVDGSTFPFLPSKNITFTLIANAIRVAECAF